MLNTLTLTLVFKGRFVPFPPPPQKSKKKTSANSCDDCGFKSSHCKKMIAFEIHECKTTVDMKDTFVLDERKGILKWESRRDNPET
jgi:predicted nucleic acid binding AN1-type Zn finger protein